MIKLNFDGKMHELEQGKSIIEIVKNITKIDNTIIAFKFNNKLVDFSYTPNEDGDIETVTNSSEEGLDILRHSTSHLMAHAIKRLFPDAKPTIGPSIKDGFYYDFDIENPFTEEDLPKIEAEMKKIVKENVPIKMSTMKKDEAIEYFSKLNENYKVEIISDLEADIFSFYEQGDFIDLCRGPHVPNTGYLKVYKLMSVAGSYWRGNSKNKMLSRIYGTAFPTRDELDAHIKYLKEAKERDHRKLGRELNLFSFHEEGPGFPFWHANGTILYKQIEAYAREENEKRGYSEIKTPAILNEKLWHQSGHWANYADNMYFTEIDENKYAVKPMNCPGGLLVFNSNIHSYKELPMRVAELGFVHRHELSGALHGLFRVRSFTQDDAHVFCTEEQLGDEIVKIIEYVFHVYKTFGFEDVSVSVATRPEKSIGTDENWELATKSLINALKSSKLDFSIEEGDGAFYGPKIDFKIKDVLNRYWQCATLQVDFSMPTRFDISYEGSDGKKHAPIMLHRTILGSFERFIGILVEHYNGKFPLWLSPVQIGIINVLDEAVQIDRVKEIEAKFKELGFRVDTDCSNENLGTKIRKFRLQRIPYTVIIGATECENETLSLRLRSGEEMKELRIDELIEKLLVESKRRMNESIFSA